MKRVFIVNPIAGKGKALIISKAIQSICEQENMDYIIHYTTAKAEATLLAKQYSYDIEPTIIYSVGGDGTLNEVVNGLALSKSILGIIPAGTGNDFVRSLDSQKENISTVDLGKVNDKYFINIASLGIDAEIANNVEIMKKKSIPNSLVYYASIFYTLAKYKTCKININDQNYDNYITLLAACNGRYYGGGIKIAPSAELNDGLMDVYLVDKLSKLQISYLLTKLMTGEHEKYSAIHKFRTNNIKIKSEEFMVCNVDGEIIVNNCFEISIIKDGINVVENDHPKIMQLSKMIK